MGERQMRGGIGSNQYKQKSTEEISAQLKDLGITAKQSSEKLGCMSQASFDAPIGQFGVNNFSHPVLVWLNAFFASPLMGTGR